MNKSDAVYNRNQAIAEFIGCECCRIDESASIPGYDRNIREIYSMISHFIENGNKSEVSYWRQMLQEVKIARRCLKKMVDDKGGMEDSYS